MRATPSFRLCRSGARPFSAMTTLHSAADVEERVGEVEVLDLGNAQWMSAPPAPVDHPSDPLDELPAVPARAPRSSRPSGCVTPCLTAMLLNVFRVRRPRSIAVFRRRPVVRLSRAAPSPSRDRAR
jgi:hypothetical protein